MSHHQDVEFNTLDGLTLRGWLYPASARGPGVVITPGVGKSVVLKLSLQTMLHLPQPTRDVWSLPTSLSMLTGLAVIKAAIGLKGAWRGKN